MSPGEFEHSAGSFVAAVLARLENELSDNEEVARLSEPWHAIRSANSAEAELCRALAVMGLDPYDAGEVTDGLIEAVERSGRVLPDDLRADLFEGSDANSIVSNLAWVEREQAGLRTAIDRARFPTIDAVTAETAHDLGYVSARRVRSELLGLSGDRPVQDLRSVLVHNLGWIADCTRVVANGVRLEGMVGLAGGSPAPILVISDRRNEAAERFRLARAAFFPVTQRLGSNGRLLTSSATPPQRAARAFAAELLAPAEGLARRVSGRLSDHDLENLAAEFLVSPQVIRHQVENHGIGYVDT